MDNCFIKIKKNVIKELANVINNVLHSNERHCIYEHEILSNRRKSE